MGIVEEYIRAVILTEGEEVYRVHRENWISPSESRLIPYTEKSAGPSGDDRELLDDIPGHGWPNYMDTEGVEEKCQEMLGMTSDPKLTEAVQAIRATMEIRSQMERALEQTHLHDDIEGVYRLIDRLRSLISKAGSYITPVLEMTGVRKTDSGVMYSMSLARDTLDWIESDPERRGTAMEFSNEVVSYVHRLCAAAVNAMVELLHFQSRPESKHALDVMLGVIDSPSKFSDPVRAEELLDAVDYASEHTDEHDFKSLLNDRNFLSKLLAVRNDDVVRRAVDIYRDKSYPLPKGKLKDTVRFVKDPDLKQELVAYLG